MSAVACQIISMSKSFGVNKVLRNINLDLFSGQVTVLMGANGAGKSTLVKILCGVHKADSGTVKLFGNNFQPSSPSDAFKKGIVTVHQSINDGVVPDLDIASNLMLDKLGDSSWGFFVRNRQLKKAASEIAASMGIKFDVSKPVRELGIADRQLIAIARAMAQDPKVLILDEPTSALSVAEAERLFKLIERFRKTGVAILYISHRMGDIRRIADRIISMRDGEIAGLFEGKALDYEGAITAMLGHSMTEFNVNVEQNGPLVLSFENIKIEEKSQPINLSVHKNEVVAITGLLGSGKSRLAEILFGLRNQLSGILKLNDKEYYPKSPRDALKSSVHMSPKDRATNAIISDFDITGNLTVPFLKSFSYMSFIQGRTQRNASDEMIEKMGIVCQSSYDKIGTLSGGNQQKVIVGRWLLKSCDLLVLDEPFQGVDIKARRDIGSYIRSSTKDRATLVFVSEIDEALEIADKIIIMSEASVVGEHINHEVDFPTLLTEFSGKKINHNQRYL